MSEKMYWCAVRYRDGFIKAMTISEKHQPAVGFALKNLGFYVALMSVAQIESNYIRLGVCMSFPRTHKIPFASL